MTDQPSLMPDAPVQVSLIDQIRELDRELGLRARVYPRWVQSKQMTQAASDRHMAAMRAARDTLAGLLAAQSAMRRQTEMRVGTTHGELAAAAETP